MAMLDDDAGKGTGEAPVPVREKMKVRWGLIIQCLGALVWLIPPFAVAVMEFDRVGWQTGLNTGRYVLLSAKLLVFSPVVVICVLVLGYLALARHSGLARAGDAEEASRERRRAYAGIRMGCALPALLLLKILIFDLPQHSGPTGCISCLENLKRLDIAFEDYAEYRSEKDPHYFPQLSAEPGRLAILNQNPGEKSSYLEYLMTLTVLYCPSANWRHKFFGFPRFVSWQACLDESDYLYLGYALHDDTEVEDFADAYRKRVEEKRPFDGDLTVTAKGTPSRVVTFHRLRKNMVDISVDPVNGPPPSAPNPAQIPLLIERLGHHWRSGAHVLYLDGHVAFQPYPGPWPMTEKTMGILSSLELLKGIPNQP